MKQITKKILKEVLKNHELWLRNEGGERADLSETNLRLANLRSADLRSANLSSANLRLAELSSAELSSANLIDAKGLVKLMGVLPGNYYYKRFEKGLNNNGYQFYVGLNILPDNEEFASDERVMCSYPGFHFASQSWCAINYGNRKLEALIKIPTKKEYENIQINEPWATDGKASANAIIICNVIDVETGEDVTQNYTRNKK